MTEPIYHFVKDKGWIPATHETLTRMFGNVEITLTHKRPEIGDYFWADSENLNDTMESMDGYWVSYIQKGYKPGACWVDGNSILLPSDENGKRSNGLHLCVISYRIL